MYSESQLIEIVKGKLNEDRFYHSLCVADSAEELAKKYGCDEKKARICGILHDIMKNTPLNQQLDFLTKQGISLTDTELSNPKLYHALSGAEYVKSILKIDDEEIYNAVRYHTTARKGMSLMEKVIYIADFISADRDYDDVDIMRKKAEESLESAMLYGLKYSIAEITSRGSTLHPDSVDAYNELILGGYGK